MKKELSNQGLSENTSYKIVALLITLILWVIILGSKEASLIKVTATNYILPPDMVITSAAPGEVSFRLIGPRLPLKRFSEVSEPLSVDLSSAVEGTTTIRIHPDSIDVPPGIRVTNVNPASVTLKLEKIITKSYPVDLVLKGKLPDGAKLGKVKVVPHHYDVAVLKSSADKIKGLRTEPLDLGSLHSTFRGKLALIVDEPGIVKRGEKPEAEVTIEVKTR